MRHVSRHIATLGFAGAALLLATPHTSHAQQASDTSIVALQATFRKYVAADSNVGATLLVMRNGAALLQDNVGMGDRELKQPVTNATIYHWGSITKTLTAIALLFALYLMKPAPFCVFDEVDAPLDDANIQKFNKIIKKFSAQSQFIIVTHNKTTMAAVDTIYGVYMEEQGVSGLSQVDFREFDETDVLALQN